MDYRALFDSVRQRPGMYFTDPSYPVVAAFVLGVDAGNAWCLLHGFREWLVVKFNAPTNLVWNAAILQLTFRETPELWESSRLSPDQHKTAIDLLFRLLDDFLADRDRSGGLEEIFKAYMAYLQDQEQEDES